MFLFVFFAGIFSVYADEKDSIVSRRSVFVIPRPGYQPETSWLAGVSLGYYFKSNDISRISSISGSAEYTLLHQFIFNITPKIYFGDDKKWYLYSNLNFRNYPDFFYGIGNTPTNIKQLYTAQNFNALLQPQYALTREIYVGGTLSYRNERVKTDSTFEQNKAEIYERFGAAGWSHFSQIQVGVMVSYDSRDSQFYPEKGIFAKTTLATSHRKLGSDYTITDFSVDFRNYIPLFGKHVFAWQAIYQAVLSKDAMPFQLVPTLGGRDQMRGFRQGIYRENVLMMLQSEYRLPIYKRLKAAIFMSAGDVVNSENYHIDKLKVAYGAGLRYRLNDARVHLRVDFAKNNYGDKLQFYITATEAF
ncbi:MAG: outer membrane protein assembly factor [Prevotellaceae bacterium]|nr:outer membrane protein assembly factor [Prevotellaceae bacterium]